MKRIVMLLLAVLLLASIACVTFQVAPNEATPPPAAQTVTAAPTAIATATPTAEPTEQPTEQPTAEPTATAEPTEQPTPEPTATPEPTEEPNTLQIGGTTVKRNAKKVRIAGKRNALLEIQPDEMKALAAFCPNLESLILDFSYLSDYTVLSAFISLTRLQITTTVTAQEPGNPLTNIEWISGLNKLVEVELGHNKIHDLSPLVNLPKLRILNLGDNDLVDADLAPLGKLPAVRSLYLYSNRELTDVSALAGIETLQLLHIGNCRKIKNVDKLVTLPKLNDLNLSYDTLTSLDRLSAFQNLETLRLYHCPFVNKAGYYDDLANCKKLTKIIIGQNDTELETALNDVKSRLNLDKLVIETADY